MTTTELIELLKNNEKTAMSGIPREIQLKIKDGEFFCCPDIELCGSGNGLGPVELLLQVKGTTRELPPEKIASIIASRIESSLLHNLKDIEPVNINGICMQSTEITLEVIENVFSNTYSLLNKGFLQTELWHEDYLSEEEVNRLKKDWWAGSLCTTCRFNDMSETEQPCKKCVRRAKDMWRPKQQEPKIRRMDICKSTQIFEDDVPVLVTSVRNKKGKYFIDGLFPDGGTICDRSMEKLVKVGHCDSVDEWFAGKWRNLADEEKSTM